MNPHDERNPDQRGQDARQRTPLDAEEQALARAWRTLPDGEPAAGIDASIRARAHAAAAERQPRIRPWAWGVSTAAAAVLALGLLWRAGLPPSQEGALYEDSAYRTPAAAPPAIEGLLDAQEAQHATSARDVSAPSPPAAAAEAMRDAPAEPVPALPPPPPAAPPARARASSGQTGMQRDLTAPTPQLHGTVPLAEPLPEAPIVAPAVSAAEPMVGTEALQAERFETPQAWLQHIEDLLAAGDLAGTRAQLRAFRARYPDHVLPASLRSVAEPGTD